jgi:vacuolar-type H+-ATPase subunit H
MIDTKDADARADIKRIEQEAMAEAEASVEDFDALGDKQAAAEAAETVFDFEEAQRD